LLATLAGEAVAQEARDLGEGLGTFRQRQIQKLGVALAFEDVRPSQSDRERLSEPPAAG